MTEHAPTLTSDGGWVLNPATHFPITLYGVHENVVRQLRAALDSERTFHEIENDVFRILVTADFLWKELEDYVAEFKPRYQNIVERLRDESEEWQHADEDHRQSLLDEFRHRAVQELDVQHECDPVTIFESELVDHEMDNRLLALLGFDGLDLYMSQFGGRATAIQDGKYPDPKVVDSLVRKGVAVRGADVPLADILQCLTLKELKSLIQDSSVKAFRRKAKAVEYLVHLPDIVQRMTRLRVNIDEYFQVLALPKEYADVDLDQIRTSWDYARTVATLLLMTYHSGIAAHAVRLRDEELTSNITFAEGGGDFEIVTLGDAACPYCRRMAQNEYPASGGYPRVPFHIGCHCQVGRKDWTKAELT
jgi:hypothetical protein